MNDDLRDTVLNNKEEVLRILAASARNEKYVKKTLTIPESLNTLAVAAGLNFSQCLREGIINALK